MTYYHFTCDHGRRGIGMAGAVRPNRAILPALAWFTDLENPDRGQLGLTSLILDCDRMTHRYRVTNPDHVTAWADADVPEPYRLALESADGADPEHWFVATRPVPVRLDFARRLA